MLRSEAIALISQRLGKRSGLDAEILVELKVQQTKLERDVMLPWFLMKDDYVTSLSTAVGVDYVALPTDFLRESDDENLYIYDVSADNDARFTKLEKGTSGDSRPRYQGSGKPRFYSLVGTRVVFDPTPDAVYALRWKYFAAALPLTTDIENKWLLYAPLYLCGHVGAALAASMGNGDALQLFAADIASERTRLQNETTAREEAGRERTMGERP